jgi:predicted RNase H-like nuclease
VLYVGVDLAWGPGVTGLAAVDSTGDLVAATWMRTDAEILNWLAPRTAGPCLVAIDAPIVVRNATGNRPCEKLVGRYFGGYGASCHSANTVNPAFSGGTRALRLADSLGLDIDPGSAAERRAIEVYPHPAIVALFDLPSIVRYKDKPGRDLSFLRTETQRLLGLLEDLENAPVRLRARPCPAWNEIRCGVETAATKAALGRVQDSIDAVVCAYVARLAHLSPERVRILGTVRDGYILTPVTRRIAGRIDADRSRGRPAGGAVVADSEAGGERPFGPSEQAAITTGKAGERLNSHYGNPAALVFKCPKCHADPGVMCSGAARPETYRYTIHKSRQILLEMPQDRGEWDERMALVRDAFRRLGNPPWPRGNTRGRIAQHVRS